MISPGPDGYLLVGSKGFESMRELRAKKDRKLSVAFDAIEELRHEIDRMRAQLDALMSSHDRSRHR